MPLGSEHGNPGHRRSARPEAMIGRAPRRGSLARIMGRPAEVFRPWGGGIVAHVTMTTTYRAGACLSPCRRTWWAACFCRRTTGRTVWTTAVGKRAGGGDGGVRGCGGGALLPRLIATTITNRRRTWVLRAGDSPAWIRHCPRERPRSCRRRGQPERLHGRGYRRR